MLYIFTSCFRKWCHWVLRLYIGPSTPTWDMNAWWRPKGQNIVNKYHLGAWTVVCGVFLCVLQTTTPINQRDDLTCDRVGTLTTTVDKYGHFSSWTPCLDSLLLYPQCTSLRTLHMEEKHLPFQTEITACCWHNMTHFVALYRMTSIHLEHKWQRTGPHFDPKAYPSSHTGHSWRSSWPLRCCHPPPMAAVYRWWSGASRSWRL